MRFISIIIGSIIGSVNVLAESTPASTSVQNVTETLEKVAETAKGKSFLFNVIKRFTEQDFLEDVLMSTLSVTFKILIAFLVFKVGQKIITFLIKTFDRLDQRSHLEKDIHIFLRSLISIVSYMTLFIIVLLILGVQQSALAAIFGAAGVGIGFALKDTLSNFAGGLILLFFKPYKTGDFIEVNGNQGEVQGIGVFSTDLNTIDNKKIIVPNGILVANEITNFSKNNVRRVEIIFGIAYKDDFRKAIRILEEVSDSQEKVLQKIEKTIRVKTLADNSVNIIYRVWCKTGDYWAVYYDSIELAKEAFDREGISIPFPQRDIHIIKDEDDTAEDTKDSSKSETSEKNINSVKQKDVIKDMGVAEEEEDI